MQDEECGCNWGPRGVLFPWGADTGYACIEKCDTCAKYSSDDDAAQALSRFIMGAGLLGFYVKEVQVLDDIEEAGAVRLALYFGDKPLTSEEGDMLVEFLKRSAVVQTWMKKRLDLIIYGNYFECPKHGRFDPLTVKANANGDAYCPICHDEKKLTHTKNMEHGDKEDINERPE